MIELHSTKCCGMAEINNLSHCKTPAEAMSYVKPRISAGVFEWIGEKHRPSFVVFTGVTKRKYADHASGRADDYGQAFADYIETNDLGRVTRSGQQINWTTNTIRVWVWEPNYEKLERHECPSLPTTTIRTL